MPRSGATVPYPVNPSGTIRRVICIPDSPEWIAVVNGLLYPATQEWYWNANTGDVAAVVRRAQQMYFQYQDQNGGCDVTLPIGMIAPFAALSVPSGWLACDGSLVAKATYPLLWDVLGDWWGTPTDTHFYVPDMRNRSPFGYDGAIPPMFPFASYQGELEHTLTTDEIPAHHHTTYPTTAGSDWNVISGAAAGVDAATPSATFRTWDTGGGEPHNNIHPVAVCTFIIYAGG